MNTKDDKILGTIDFSPPTPDGTLGELVRDLTQVGSITKSEAKRRITEMIDLGHLSGIRIGKQVMLENVGKVVEEMRLDADVFYNKKHAQEILTALKEQLKKLL
jgi:polyhydroxyalkanoate synthesis regulator phasin